MPLRAGHFSQPPEVRRADLGGEGMETILARPLSGESLLGKVLPGRGFIKLPKGEQTLVGFDLGSLELQLQAGIEGDPELIW